MKTEKEILERIKLIHGDQYDYTKFKYNGMHKKVCIICLRHGEFWQTPHSHLKGQGCPKCALEIRTEKKKYSTNTFIEKAKEIHGDKYDYSRVKYIDSKTKVEIICPKHGSFFQKPYLHLRGQGCMECFNEQRKNMFKKDFNDFIEQLNRIYGNKYDFTKYNYINYNTRESVTCDKHGIFYRSPYELLNKKECPLCMKEKKKQDRIILESKNFVKKANIIHKGKYKYDKVNYINCNKPVEIICPKHGSFWQKPSYHLEGNGCQKCSFEMSVSGGELEINNFISELGLKTETNKRTFVYPYELDIYIPDKKVAIEYDGLYWHNELNKDSKYHLNKTELCEKQGIRLIHIFEDEWLYKQNIVKSRLKSVLGLTDEKIYARKCKIKDVSFSDCKIFLEKNHIQGNVNAKHRYGLYYNDELVSLMTFGSKRKNLGSKSEDESYELLRFCNKLNTTVVGGASRLMNYFIKTHNPKEIISYCDRRWSVGNMYEKLGFTLDHVSRPSYFYIKGDKRYNRFGYRKDILIKQGFDKNKTEHEIMLERGIYRIYDCGTKVYKWEKGN